MNRYRLFVLLGSLMVVTGVACTPSQDEVKAPAKAEGPVEACCQTPGEQKAVPPEDIKTLVEGNNEFAFDLYHRLSQKEGNIIFSPYSISTALAMTYAGARGNTAREMAKTLHFTLDQEPLHPAFGELIRQIEGAGKKPSYELAVANSLWGARGLSLEPRFLRLTQSDYRADFETLEFASDAEGARRRINGWVEDKTNKKIQDLLAKGVVDQTTRLVLVNAIYFKGDWSDPFPKEATKPEDFTMPDATAVKVPMMNLTTVANYMANADFQLAELRYKDNEVSMVVILPRKKDGLAEVESKLSARSLTEALALVQAARLRAALPRFKMTERFSLGGDLAKMGMQEVFHRDKADFTGMSIDAGPKSGFSIAEVVHKAYVEVHETGTEAAAATAVDLPVNVSKPGAPIPFRADRSFLFLLRHNATGSILFLGRVSDPRVN